MQQLQDNYFKQQPISPGPGRPAVVPLTTEQKDLAQAVQWFKGMGWEEAAESGMAAQATPLSLNAFQWVVA